LGYHNSAEGKDRHRSYLVGVIRGLSQSSFPPQRLSMRRPARKRAALDHSSTRQFSIQKFQSVVDAVCDPTLS